MDGIRAQYESIRRNWGADAAERYLRIASQPIPSDDRRLMPPVKEQRWVSNRVYQVKRFGDEQVRNIRQLINQGATYEQVARQFGCCKATVHYVAKGKGAYKNYSQQW